MKNTVLCTSKSTTAVVLVWHCIPYKRMYVLYVLTVQIKSQVGGVHKKNSKSSKFKSLRRTVLVAVNR
jgi:hypothetical protein